RPARVAEPGRAGERPRLKRAREVIQLADGPNDLDLRSVVNREAGRVVAAVLELSETFEQDRRRLARAHVTNDSTHACCPNPIVSRRSAGIQPVISHRSAKSATF